MSKHVLKNSTDVCDRVLILIHEKGMIKAKEVQQIFDLSDEALIRVMDLLTKSGFAKLGKSGKYVMLNPRARSFLEQEMTLQHNYDD